MSLIGSRCITISHDYAGQRLDSAVAQLLPELSRSVAANLIKNENVLVDNLQSKPGYRLRGGERVEITLETPLESSNISGQPLDLDILYEDKDIIVLNKKPGMVVHPAPGNYKDTLLNALLYRFPEITEIGGDRPGIVHRLDKGTSGVMVVAKNPSALCELASQFQNRSLEKIYLALVWGVPSKRQGEINFPIGRHPVNRKKMSIHSRKGRNAITLWRIKESYPKNTLLEICIKTGRTHQIRVHCGAINHPVVGDPVYGGSKNKILLNGLSSRIQHQIEQTQRQMLHAWKLTIIHPSKQQSMTFTAPIPSDMNELINMLKKNE